jgi:uncharacterized protein (TIGR03086 family)
MSDVADRYIRLADQFGARVEAAPDERWNDPSPCEGWAARDVVSHVVDSQRRMLAAFEGSEATPMADDEDPKAAWRETYASFKAAINDDANMQKLVPGPMGEMPAEFMVGRFLATDVLVHTWDLARAVGGDERIDEEAAAQALKGLQPMDAMIRQPGVFGEKVEAPEGADAQTQLLCFLGRRP